MSHYLDINLTTPALLFPAISLLLLAYTNRFLALAALIRNLHAQYQAQPDPLIIRQIDNLRRRVYLIRNMQGLGVVALLLCTICMFLLFLGDVQISKWIFALSLLLLIGSMSLSVWEINISVIALDLQLKDLEEKK